MNTSAKGARSALKVGLVQFKPRKAQVQENLQGVRDRVREMGAGHDLLVFPEVSLTGYFLEGGVAEAAMPAEEVIRGLGTPGEDAPDVVLGFYERWRRGVYNSVVYLEPRDDAYHLVHVHRKMFLPTYGIFEEARFVEAGRDVRAFDTRFGRMGLLICEEMWHSLPSTILALDGAEAILLVSASPAREFRPGAGKPGNLVRWDSLARATSEEHGIFVAVCQLVGSEGGKVFPGGSVVTGPDGRFLARGPLLEEGVVTASLEGDAIDRARFETPLLADLQQMLPHLQRSLARTLNADEEKEAGKARPRQEGGGSGAQVPRAMEARPTLQGRQGGELPSWGPDPRDPSVLDLDLELVRRTLVEFIREEVEGRRGFDGVVLGVSGGVDSSVSLYLAVEALGPEHVTGFRLPYATSSPESLEHARMVLEATGAGSETIDISSAVNAYIQEWGDEISDLRRGNLAARMRGVTLFDQSAKLGRLPLGTGNKSERALGYFTWHADDAPPINPLGDLFKTQVWDLARHLGIPEVIVEKPASADLVRGIDDEDELGFSYHMADPILYWFLRGYQPDDLVRHGFEEDAVRLVWKRLNGTHWKRELPTVAVLSATAIGEFYLRPVDY
jgi:NAD+ synthetase